MWTGVERRGVTVSQFLIALRAIAGNCGFGPSLDERLRPAYTGSTFVEQQMNFCKFLVKYQ